MKTSVKLFALAILLKTDVEAVKLGETQIVKIIPDEYDAMMGLDKLNQLKSTEEKPLVDVAIPLIEHVLENSDDTTIKKVVRDILEDNEELIS